MDPDLTAVRAAQNQSTFREANEQLEERADAIGVRSSALPFICECPDPSCSAIVLIARDEYERIRAHGAWFLAAPGHETCVFEDVEVARVVERNEAYSIMEKIGTAKDAAKQLDPRG